MKYVNNKTEFFALLPKSDVKPNGYRLLPEAIKRDIGLVLLNDNVPIPIINTVYGIHNLIHPSQRKVYCQFFWIGQAYPCWVSVHISKYRKFPVYE